MLVTLEAGDLDNEPLEHVYGLDEALYVYLSFLDLYHLLVLLLATLDRLVEEEVGNPEADSVARFTVGSVNLLQLLECTVGSHAPALG